MELDFWCPLNVFENKTRIELIHLLLHYEVMSLSEIQKRLKETFDHKMTLAGLLKHMNELLSAGIVRQESGGFLQDPDARKTVYLIQGKERVMEILQAWSDLGIRLTAGITFSKLSRSARSILGSGTIPQPDEIKELEESLEICESDGVSCHLTENERKKMKFWRMTIANMGTLFDEQPSR